MLAHRESGVNARALFDEATRVQGIEPGQLIAHADRGVAPRAKSLTMLFADLGVERSYSRPHVSNDNPYSEAQFKTMKYAPGYPDRFGGYEHARSWARHFFPWYNTEHRHLDIAYLTPAMVHYGQADAVLDARHRVLEQAYAAHPERFVHRRPRTRACGARSQSDSSGLIFRAHGGCAMNAKEQGCATHRGNHPDATVWEAVTCLAETGASSSR